MKTNCRLRLAILAALSSGSAMAGEVVFDGTLPGTTAGALAASASTYSINQDRGFVNGSNLFHSFQQFNIDAGETATFQSADAIRHILSRVTGNMPTTINGTLRASSDSITSFWLINPAGLMVGETAVLHIPGAVALGAADVIQFSNGEFWSALNDGFSDATTLSVEPVDFGFIENSTAADLSIRGQNFESSGADQIVGRGTGRGPHSWLLSGGSGVTIESETSLVLSEVKIETAKGAVMGSAATGNIFIASVADVIIDDSFIVSTSFGDDGISDGAGSIDIRGSSVTLNESLILSATSTDAAAGNIGIVGSNIILNGSTIKSSTSGRGDAGFISLDGFSVALNESNFESEATGTGNVGIIGVGKTDGFSELDNSSITATESKFKSSTTSAKDAGQIVLQADTIRLDGGAFESSTSGGGAAAQITLGSGIYESTDRDGSSITLGGTTFNSSTTGAGNAGPIVLQASKIVLNDGNFTSSTSGTGDAGLINIGSGLYVLPAQDGSSLTLVDSVITTSTSGSGKAGVIDLRSNDLLLSRSGISSKSERSGAGDGGSIDLTTGPSGVLRIEESQIGTDAVSASGGNIVINAGRSPITLRDTTIEASAGADGQGGDITISSAGQTIVQRSGILARADAGNGGDITITVSPGDVFVQDSASLVNADSQLGINGNVTINSPNTDLNSALQPQDVDVSRPAALGSNACAPATAGSRSTFVLAGRGGVSEKPDGYLTSIAANSDQDVERSDTEIEMSGRESSTTPTASAGTVTVASLGTGCL